ncbi:Glycosyltransferase involved in cell wall bisynthesis [Eubacterium aggregans]|uniref:Glycosyltransferase involved in cell wall bisynthesis n=1 Tax=Eubacterium aggregans TaxID=81409 RepID=A0A1H3Y9X3_9FIRM|nr:glycosyltransferase [Eubacterium aggregans]SEA08323.1 Glycosyltransferase involved in cell wall bisynthesis [Eubacterium aggregans]
MKKILIMNDLLQGGGVEKVLFDLVNNIPTDDYDITILTMNEDMHFYDIYSRKIKYISMFKNINRDIGFLKKQLYRVYRKIRLNQIKQKIIKERYDIAVAIKEGPCMKFISTLPVNRKIAWVHTDYEVFHWTKGVFGSNENEKTCMERFDAVICVSKAAKNSVISTIGDPENLVVCYNPLDCELMKEMSKNSHKGIDTRANKKPLIVTVGRLVKQKGYDRLLQACQVIKDQYDFEIWIIGDGDLKDEFVDYIDENELSPIIKLLGKKENPYPYIKAADYFICTSEGESFGLAVQEAVILGTPVISVDCPAICELLRSQDGLIFENSIEGITDGLKYMCTHNPQKEFQMMEYTNEEFMNQRIEKIMNVLGGGQQ